MSVKFATFNLYQFAEPPVAWYQPDNLYTDGDWQAKRQWVIQQLTNIGADVVGFQEVFSVDALRDAVLEAGYPEFAVVAHPKLDEHMDNVYYAPVVAIASKHPIKTIDAVEVNSNVLKQMPIAQDFAFSRATIRAVVAMPEIGDTTVYVTHLKAKVAAVPEALLHSPNSGRDGAFEAAKGVSVGQIVSLIQRGVEATMIYQDVMDQISKDNNLPIVVMGDMNDTKHSVIIDALTNQLARYNIDGRPYETWSDEEKVANYQAKLFDAYYLVPNQFSDRRIATHFYGTEGKVMDFIFVSNGLNVRNPAHIARPTDYEVINGHLHADGSCNLKQSDHAPVVLTLTRQD